MSVASDISILVVEADAHQAHLIADQLSADGYGVELARSAAHARSLVRHRTPGLAVLGSLDSPRGALGLLEEIRHSQSSHEPWDRAMPTIVLGASAGELEVLRAFEAGADDFIASPAHYLELRARLRAILRRTGAENTRDVLEVGVLEIDMRAHQVRLAGHIVGLRRLEFDLLVQLAREPQRVFAKDELLRTVWGYSLGGTTRTVDSHASRLRRKLNADGSHRWVVNVWGVGYRLT